jgi:hypothetical protein
MSLKRLHKFDEDSIRIRWVTSGDVDPCPREISAKLALIRSNWTGQEGLRRIRRARCFHEWLLALSQRGLAQERVHQDYR